MFVLCEVGACVIVMFCVRWVHVSVHDVLCVVGTCVIAWCFVCVRCMQVSLHDVLSEVGTSVIALAGCLFCTCAGVASHAGPPDQYWG